MNPVRLAEHWKTLDECERSGAKPAVYRELLEAITELQTERDFLLARAEGANRARFNVTDRWTGLSSNALVRHAFGGLPPAESEFPRDPDDLASCYRAVRRLPEHLKERGNAWLAHYRAAMEKEGHYSLAEMDALLHIPPTAAQAAG